MLLSEIIYVNKYGRVEGPSFDDIAKNKSLDEIINDASLIKESEYSQISLYKNIRIYEMYSKNKCLLITDEISWEQFTKFANFLLGLFEAKLINKEEGITEIIWLIEIKGGRFYLCFDDYPLGVTIESVDDNSDLIIPDIEKKLQETKVYHPSDA